MNTYNYECTSLFFSFQIQIQSAEKMVDLIVWPIEFGELNAPKGLALCLVSQFLLYAGIGMLSPCSSLRFMLKVCHYLDR
jgi:hypothetical protein